MKKNFYSIYKQNIDEAVIHFSKMSYQNGLDGMVCSVFESKKIKEHTNSNFLTLTPEIRPFGKQVMIKNALLILQWLEKI